MKKGFLKIMLASSIALISFGIPKMIEAGTVKTWGNNSSGQLGNGTTNPRSAPGYIGLDDVSAIAAGPFHSLAAKSNGTVWQWNSQRDIHPKQKSPVSW